MQYFPDFFRILLIRLERRKTVINSGGKAVMKRKNVKKLIKDGATKTVKIVV